MERRLTVYEHNAEDALIIELSRGAEEAFLARMVAFDLLTLNIVTEARALSVFQCLNHVLETHHSNEDPLDPRERDQIRCIMQTRRDYLINVKHEHTFEFCLVRISV